MGILMQKEGSTFTLMRLKSHTHKRHTNLSFVLMLDHHNHIFYMFKIYTIPNTYTTRQHTHEWTEQNYLSFSLSLLDWHQQACQPEHHSSSAQMWAWPLSPIWLLPPNQSKCKNILCQNIINKKYFQTSIWGILDMRFKCIH